MKKDGERVKENERKRERVCERGKEDKEGNVAVQVTDTESHYGCLFCNCHTKSQQHDTIDSFFYTVELKKNPKTLTTPRRDVK